MSQDSVQGYLGQLLQEYPYDLDHPAVESELKPKVQYLFDSSMDRAFAEAKRNIIGYLLFISFLIALAINVDVFQMFKSFTQPPGDMLKQVPKLGWGRAGLNLSAIGWMTKILGWLISAIVMAYGASFLFQVINKIVNIRSTHRTTARPQVVIPTGKGKLANGNLRSGSDLSFNSKPERKVLIHQAEKMVLDFDLTSKENLLRHLPTMKKLVSDGELELAVQTVLLAVDLIPEDNQNELFALSGRYKDLLKDQSQNVISPENFDRNESQIRIAFLRFVDRLKDALS